MPRDDFMAFELSFNHNAGGFPENAFNLFLLSQIPENQHPMQTVPYSFYPQYSTYQWPDQSLECYNLTTAEIFL